jgi:hypothetical protein
MVNKVFLFVNNFNILPIINSSISKKDKNYLFIKGDKNLKIALDYNFQKTFKIFLLDKNFIICSIQIFFFLLFCKLKNYKVNFYHYAYWPSFDFLIEILKIKSNFYNFLYHDLSGKSKVDRKVISFFSLQNLSVLKKIRFFILSKTFYKSFDFLYRKVDNSTKKNTVIIVKKRKYHKGVKFYNLNYLECLPKTEIKKKTNKILILAGKSIPGKDIVTKSTLNQIIKICLKKKYSVFFKNHPMDDKFFDPSFKKINKINIIDSLKVIEFEKDDYKFIFSFSSTSLMKFGKRSICLIKFWGKTHYKDIYKFYKNSGGKPEKMFFPDNIRAINQIL